MNESAPLPLPCPGSRRDSAAASPSGLNSVVSVEASLQSARSRASPVPPPPRRARTRPRAVGRACMRPVSRGRPPAWPRCAHRPLVPRQGDRGPKVENFDACDKNGDGIAVIDIERGGSDFEVTNSDWVLNGDGSKLFIFRIRGGGNMQMSNAAMLLGDGGPGGGSRTTHVKYAAQAEPGLSLRTAIFFLRRTTPKDHQPPTAANR